MAIIQSDGKTHTGKVREHNEDSIFSSDQRKLWIVADGMGGHACGEVASRITVDSLAWSAEQGSSLPAAIDQAHAAVIKEAESNTRAQGMGTTVVIMRAVDEQYQIAWVGDSRAYLLRDQSLQQLTRDHSYLEWLKDSGVAVEQAHNHPKRNIITQSIGVGEPSPDMITGRLQPGDRYLLCSDGLSDELKDEEIEHILQAAGDSRTASQRLIDAALDRGGRDNISIIVLDVDPDQRVTAKPLVDSIKTAASKLLSMTRK